jgi:beta-glucosidase
MQETIIAIQAAGVQAVAKHFVGNEQETMRMDEMVDGVDLPSLSSNVDDRTLHELYVWPFANSVRAGVSAVMCSYNRLNGTYACENPRALDQILKRELGFQGYVMSDWFATHSGVRAINAGLDMDQPGPLSVAASQSGDLGSPDSVPSFFGRNITIALRNHSLSEARLNDMVQRVMTPYFHLGQDQEFPTPDASGMYASSAFTGLTSIIPIENAPPARDVQADHATVIRTVGAESIVLLKNTGSALPLKNPQNIGVFGNDASPVTAGLYLSGSNGNFYTTADGTLAMGGGSGSGRATYVASPLIALLKRASQTEARVQYLTNNDLLAENKLYSIFPVPEVCLVFLKTWATESEDRDSFELDWNSTSVVNNVAALCPNTVVVTNSAGVNTMPWAENPNVTAILAAHYLGQETGNAIVDVLYGDVNPSGHLPYTIPRKATDYHFPIVTSNTTHRDNPQSNFTEGLLIDYRHFDAKQIQPLYEFGHGLSYTTFEFSGSLSVDAISKISPFPSSSPVMPGGNPTLWNTVVTVSGNVINSGSRDGSTVPQLYVSYQEAPPGTPPKALRGFDKIRLAPGQSKPFRMELMRRDLSFWNVQNQEWQIPSGEITISVGFSSRDLRLHHKLRLIK